MSILFSGTKDRHQNYRNASYSQCGEDLIIKHMFWSLKIDKPTYIDVGAHHPWKLNNTALFYLNDARGINIEPDPGLFVKFQKARKDDINLNIGVGSQKGLLDFYVMSSKTMSTFSKREADNLIKEHGFNIVEIRKVEVDTIGNVLAKYFDGKFPDFLSLDVEGLDSEILRSIEYISKLVPKIICVETISYSENGRGNKDKDICDFLISNGYMVYADTYINTIFVLEELWKR